MITIPRLITAFIFLFCGTMTTLLVRSVVDAKNSRLAKVSPRVAFDYFVGRNDPSILDVWEGNKIIGSCQINHHGPASHLKDGTAVTKIVLSLVIRLPQTILDSDYIKLTGDADLHSTGDLDDLDLELALPGSSPRVSLEIRQPPGQASPSLTLKRGAGEILYSNAPGRDQDGIMSLMVENMLKSAGLSLDTLSESPDKKKQHAPETRTGLFEAGNKSFSGYLLTNGAEDSARFDLYMEDGGEILRIDTPLTGENQLGLRFLSESCRPAGVEDPKIDEYNYLKKKK